METLRIWQRVADNGPLLVAARDTDPTDPAAVARLRRDHDADTVRIALQLVRAREKAAIKFGHRASELIADPEGVEQASSFHVAAYKAGLFKRVCAMPSVIDACCGVGGDAMAFVEAGLTVTAVDADPVRAWMASRNAGSPSAVADVSTLDMTGQLLHLDPARRAAGRRVFELDDLIPKPSVIRGLIERAAGSMIKLGPGIDVEQTQAKLGAGHATFISERGRLVQALWLTGLLQPTAPRTAVAIDAQGNTLALAGDIDKPECEQTALPGRFLLTVDPAVERAELLQRIGLPMLHPRLGLFTTDSLADIPSESRGWLIAFELLEDQPFRERAIKTWLRDHDAGIVEVKTRDKAADPDRLQTALRGKGDTPYCVFVLRFDRQVRALITRRV